MPKENPFREVKTCGSYGNLFRLTLLVFSVQVVLLLAIFLGGRSIGLEFDTATAMLPALIASAGISWYALDSLGVSFRAALRDWRSRVFRDAGKALKYFGGYLALMAVFLVLVSAAYSVGGESVARVSAPLEAASVESEMEMEKASAGTLSYLLLLLSTCVAAPVAEELFFRRIMFTSIRARKGFWASALISGTVFALFHGLTAPAIFPVGIYLCWVYEKEGRLPVNIMLHGMVNFSVIGFKILA